MRVKLDAEGFYRDHLDPWSIGDARSERYDRYRDLLLRHSSARAKILDIGCGFGAFLARFRNDFESLHGIDVSDTAVEGGRRRFPFIDFRRGSADDLDELGEIGRFDAVIFSDVINYFDDAGKARSLRWIREHLSNEGTALVAAWSPGGDYLTGAELRRLVLRHFVIEEELVLETGHIAIAARPKRHLVAITVDYETWQPLPEGMTIDWGHDVFEPTERLFALCGSRDIALTLMAELGEYFWLCDNEGTLARRMEEQWREAIRRGHDVQLHLHPSWLPELGARRNGSSWYWDWSRGRVHDYPGEVGTLLRRCRERLESILREEDPDYSVTSFRAGAYEAQPFERLYRGLIEAGISCDSSVHAGGRREGRSYDYSLAYSDRRPYYASRYDPQLLAPPAEAAIIELPVFAFERGRIWSFDRGQGQVFADHLIRYSERELGERSSTGTQRRLDALRRSLLRHYASLGRARRVVNAVLPRALAHQMVNGGDCSEGHEYFVLVGHTKAALDFTAIGEQLDRIRADGRFEFVTLSEMAGSARHELERGRSQAEGAISPSAALVPWPERPGVALDVIPLDRRNVLDFGGGAAGKISARYPWMRSVARPGADSAPPRGQFDCVYAVNGLEHARDPDRTLREIHRALEPVGALVLAVLSDAHQPARSPVTHRWKTAPPDVRLRLERAGFVNIDVEEVDGFRELGAPPHPASRDRIILARAWKRDQPATDADRLEELVRFTYLQLEPTHGTTSTDAVEIIAGGAAWCSGYTVALGEALEREGYGVEWVSMIAEGHPRGRGASGVETHEVLEVTLDHGVTNVVDPMAGVRFPCSLRRLLADPTVADVERPRDARYRERDYDLYATSRWYRRVVRVCLRRAPHDLFAYVPVDRYLRAPRGRQRVRGRRILPRGGHANRGPTTWTRVRWWVHGALEPLRARRSRLP